MTEKSPATRSVIIEREMPHLPQKVWRALTESPLIDDWLMQNDFEPVVGHGFTFRADWGSVEGKVLIADPYTTLSYTWEAFGLESVVTWTLAPVAAGTHVRMEQAGFRHDQEQAYQGAQYGWQQFFASLEKVVANVS